ncbi:recombinase family protein [Tessaracoccus massiliensis]|nr:recombinase family protein [Tessaracoccus massiliensis]
MSTAGQDPQLQVDALVGAGVERRDVFSDVTSGARSARERPGMRRLLSYV